MQILKRTGFFSQRPNFSAGGAGKFCQGLSTLNTGTITYSFACLVQRVRSAENIEELGETNWASKLVFDTSAMDKKDLSGRNNEDRKSTDIFQAGL
jgi:hypothetical protein